ncbi:ABC transporter substrate-binding protein [Spirochaeta cellobiosiphila]|uniref:ABC transporter substrate-binding protein n=1 Tax=Spirochaeta cellobiosiphila TaxID=504483 RepID=UPI00040ECAE2|nr:ABC transporter substrate-binding protein [Spirochaeta cellobiosiphila]
MKKGMIFILIALLGSFSVMAGGQNESKQVAIENVDPSGTRITYWYQHSRSREDAIQKLIKDFNETNEYGITVQGEYAGNYDEIYNKMITAIAGNSTPNLVVAYQNQAAAYQVSDALVDLNPYVTDSKWGLGTEKEDFFSGFLNSDVNAMFDGQRLGFPPNRSMEVLYYNKTWLKELGYDHAPKTWEEFAQMCMAATKGDQYGYALATGASNVFSQIVSRGGQLEIKGGGYKYDSPEMTAAMEMMKKLYDAGAVRKIVQQYGEQTDFANSICMFTIGSTSGMPYYANAVNGSDKPFEWSVAPLPTNGNKPVMNVYGASLSIPKSTPEKQLAAWIFIKYLTGKEEQAYWVRASNYFPVRKSVASELSDYFVENPRYKDAFDILNSAELTAEPPYAGYDEVRDLVSGAFNAIMDGADIKSTLSSLDKDANEVYEDAKL